MFVLNIFIFYLFLKHQPLKTVHFLNSLDSAQLLALTCILEQIICLYPFTSYVTYSLILV